MVVSEGLQKFLFPVDVGVGRFTRIGFDSPELVVVFVGVTEIACGVFVGVMAVALAMTKLPVLLSHDLGPFAVRSLDDVLCHRARIVRPSVPADLPSDSLTR